MAERGLYKFGGVLFVALMLIAAVAYATGGGRSTIEAAPAKTPEPRSAEALAGPVQPAPELADATCRPDGGLRPLDDDLRESSGVAVSAAHAGIFWTHEDSGDPLLYAVDMEGRTVGRVRVAGGTLEDWEDVARAPCPAGGDCLYVGDIGDNDARRPSITVYRVPEPSPRSAQTAPAAAIRLRYPDGAHDAEALFVLNGAIHVVTKGESGPIAIYRAPANAAPGAETVLERVRVLSPERVDRPLRITGADASPDGRWIALRTLESAEIHRAQSLLGSGALSPIRIDLRELEERQGEGIGFAPDGSLVLTSEGTKKKPATFARLTCVLP